MTPPPDRVLFIGHSCLLVTLDGLNFIVDANFSNKVLGLVKRHTELGIDPGHLPPVSALLVTHAHYDHLDLFSYKYFPQKIPIITPIGFGPLFRRLLHNPVFELKTWEERDINPVRMIAVPTRHYGFRLSGLRYVHCNSYVLQGSRHAVYLPGDTAWGPHFGEIGERFNIDVACLPIGPIKPQWLMKRNHIDAAQAVEAFHQLKAKKMVPIHWGSFRLGFDTPDEPLPTLKKIIRGTPMESAVKVLQTGQELVLDNN